MPNKKASFVPKDERGALSRYHLCSPRVRREALERDNGRDRLNLRGGKWGFFVDGINGIEGIDRSRNDRSFPILIIPSIPSKKPPPSRSSGSGATFGPSSNQEALQPMSFPLWGETDPTLPHRSHSR